MRRPDSHSGNASNIQFTNSEENKKKFYRLCDKFLVYTGARDILHYFARCQMFICACLCFSLFFFFY